MPVDPQIQTLLDRAAGVPATHTLPLAAARTQAESRVALMAPPAEIAGVREVAIDGPGGQLRLRLYTPRDAGPFPLVVFFHGSGFVLCSLDTHDGMCRSLCAGAAAIVASVDYRLAPEHKFPAGSDDCLYATRWTAAHSAELGADPARIAVAGDSAGGNMAAVTPLRVRDQGAWSTGPLTYLGLQVPGFPNLFTITGPGSPSVLCNMPVAIEQHADFITDCIAHMHAHRLYCVEATPDATEKWATQVNEAASVTLLPQAKHSWYLGANIPGKPRVFMPYAGGMARYRAICAGVALSGYEGFALSS